VIKIGVNYFPCDQNLTTQVEDGFKKESSRNDASIETRWPLLGPHLNQFVVYSKPFTAYVQTDELTSKLSRAVLKNQGMKIIRGWENVVLLTSQRRKSEPDSNTKAASAKVESNVIQAEIDITTSPRKIDHLIFAIHGYVI
jgi:hypothetical protein